MKKVCVCGDPNCDSPFHRGDKVEVQWGTEWVKGEVVAEVRTRVTVRFPYPILFTEKIVTTTITKFFWGCKMESTTEKWGDKILNEMTFGASYVRFPETKSWERP